MTMRWKIAAATLAALACLGFAEPTISPQFARLDFERTYQTGGKKPQALESGFNVYYERTCRHSKYAGFGLLTGSKHSLSVPGDIRLFVDAVAGKYQRECHGFVGFEAERGHVYAIKIEANAEGCILRVTDSATGQRPAGIRFLDGQHQCDAYMNRRD
jgi:hypothetical protein